VRLAFGRYCASLDEFDPGKRMSTRGAGLTRLALRENGRTDDMLRIWSGDTFMDLTANTAVRMTVKQIDGADYLFVEKASFNSRKKGWTPAHYVMKRVAE
jgi:hypothetical protein